MGELNLHDPKTAAMFKVNLAAGNLADDMKEEFDTMKNFTENHWEYVDPEVQEVVNRVTYALKHLIDLTNDRLKELEV